MSLSRLTIVSAALLLFGCDPAPSSTMKVASPASAGEVPPEVVVCPAGSTYDTAKSVCIATAPIGPPQPEPPPAPRPVFEVDPGAGASFITVACSFANGWVSVLPAGKYPKDDQFLMQALIGLREDPQFWGKEPEFAKFAPYAARRCGTKAEEFVVLAGSYFILAGEANTFSTRGDYSKNGFRKKVQLDPLTPIDLSLNRADLKHTWLCISCPFVSFFDPAAPGEAPGPGAPGGAFLPSFVVLKGRSSSADRGTDRVAASGVPVKGGRIRLRVVEAESEVTHLDRLALEIGGKVILPSPGARSALASDDGSEVEISRGKAIELFFDVPGAPDGPVDAVVIASGYYVPDGD